MLFEFRGFCILFLQVAGRPQRGRLGVHRPRRHQPAERHAQGLTADLADPTAEWRSPDQCSWTPPASIYPYLDGLSTSTSAVTHP